MARRKRSSATVHEVAKQAGVSIATVSRAFSLPDKVNAATREKVLQAAGDLNYTIPSVRVSEKKKVVSKHIRLIIHKDLKMMNVDQGYESQYYNRTLWALEEKTRELGHQFSMQVVHGTPEEIAELPSRCLDVSGFILLGACINVKLLDALQKIGPVVVVNDPVKSGEIPSFVFDDFSGMQLLVNHLSELGHKRLRFFQINDSRPANPHLIFRHAAYLALVLNPDLNLGKCDACVLDKREKSMNDTASDLLKQWSENDDMPTALVCANDNYALAFLQAAQDLDIKVPEQLSIVGMDDQDFSRNMNPGITTIRQPLEVLAADAVNSLHNSFMGYTLNCCQHVYGVELIVRGSSAPPPAE